jgi:enoyl-CoA hydratase
MYSQNTIAKKIVEKVHLRREGRIAILSLDNPNGGYLTAPMAEQINHLTMQLENDDSIRVIVITGHHEGTFITHYSPDELTGVSEVVAKLPDDKQVKKLRQQSVSLTRWIYRLLRFPRLFQWCDKRCRGTSLEALFLGARINAMQLRWQQSDTVFIAAINGFAMGGGCEMSLACDFRLMARGKGVIGLPESISGIIPGSGGTQRLARLVGGAQAVAMILTGKMYSADEAQTAGLIHQAVDAENFMDEVMVLAEQLAGQPALSIQGVKRAIHNGVSMSLASGIAEEATHFMGTVISRDAAALGSQYLKRRDDGLAAADIFAEFRKGDAVSLSNN